MIIKEELIIPAKKSTDQIKNFIIESVTAFLKKNRPDFALIEPFNKGIIFKSGYIYNRLLKRAYRNLKIAGADFFNPVIFSNSILNSFTQNFAEYFNIRGYSNSFILNTFDNMIHELKYSGVHSGLILEIEKTGSGINLIIYVIDNIT